jgi:hypothetical protein
MTTNAAARGAAVTARLLVVGWVGVAAATGAACKKAAKVVPPPAAVLASVEIQDVSAAAAGGEGASEPFDTGALVGVVRRALVEGGLAVPAHGADGGPPDTEGRPRATTRVRGRVVLETVEAAGKGVLRAAVGLQLASRPSDAPGAMNEELSAASEQPYEVGPEVDRHAMGQRLLERTTGDLINGYVARLGLGIAPPERVHAAIAGDAGVLREEAIRIAGARGLKGEVPTLLPLLQHEDERVRDAALGALIALRERSAVSQLTRNRSLRDRREMRKILGAIAVLGGDEARDYLTFVAASHDDEEIRKLASDAKARLDGHARSPTEMPPSGPPASR